MKKFTGKSLGKIAKLFSEKKAAAFLGSAILLIVLLFAFFVFKVIGGEKIAVSHTYIRKAHRFDRGAVHVFLKNTGDVPIRIDKVFLNGVLLENMPNETATWLQVLPNPVLSGKVSDLTIMLPQNIARYTLPMKVTIKTQKGKTLKASVSKIKGSVKITGIYFPDALDTIYIYLKNIGKTSVTPEKIYLDIKDVTARTKFFSTVIPPDKKGLLKVNLTKPLTQGEYISVRIESSGRETAQSVVRVFSFFPITSFSNPDTREELYFDPNPFHVEYKPEAPDEEIKKLPSQSAWYLMGCPNCADREKGQKWWGNSAVELIKRAQISYRVDPARPSHTHVCDGFKEWAYFIYGEVCDIMFINPYEIVFRSANPARNGYFAGLGKLACEPRPLMTIPGIFEEGATKPLPSPEQIRLDVYYQISEGVKGISYFDKKYYQGQHELEGEIGSINKELQLLKSYLKIGEPFSGIASSSEPKVKAKTIVSGDKGMVVILINTDYDAMRKAGKRYTKFTPKKNFRVHVKTPKWLDIKKVMAVDREIQNVEFQRNGEEIVIPVDNINLTKVLLLTPEQGD